MQMLFTVENQHAKECGTPPAWINGPRLSGEYRAYFENNYGEQWIASATHERLLFTGGDIGWDEHRIDKPDYAMIVNQLLITFVVAARKDLGAVFLGLGLDGVILNDAERYWLLGVCSAAAAFPSRETTRETTGG